MSKVEWVQKLFQNIDTLDIDKFNSYLSDDVTFQLGNIDPVKGKSAVGEMVGGFFGSVGGMRHEIYEIWEHPGTVICQGNVTYIRKDSSELSVPFANILRLEKDLVMDYQIYVDISALFSVG